MPTTSTQGNFEDILPLAKPELRPLCQSLRRQISLLDPDFVELVWPRLKIASFGIGPKKMTEHYAYISVQGSHVNLGFYQGASLTDPDGLLEGTGKKLRHIKCRDLASTHSAALLLLLRQAIADRRRHAGKR